MKITVICPYCTKPAKLVKGDKLYPHRADLFHKSFYLCAPCDAYVGTHDQDKKPLGRLANKELRQAKMSAHNAFDPIWRKKDPPDKARMTRRQAYKWLANQMGLELIDCHIGAFNIAQCAQVVDIIKLRQEKINAHNVR